MEGKQDSVAQYERLRDVVCVGELSLSSSSTASKVSTLQEMKGVAEEQTAKRRNTMDSLDAYIPRVPYVDKGRIKFKTESVVGSGSFGTVYRGSYQGTPAAVKKIPMEDNSDFMNELLVCFGRHSSWGTPGSGKAGSSSIGSWGSGPVAHGNAVQATPGDGEKLTPHDGEQASPCDHAQASLGVAGSAALGGARRPERSLGR
ncbi:UNVERIFIED_CONTAM: hypothetical protein FKN15_064260 [Acipenser sinensis]